MRFVPTYTLLDTAAPPAIKTPVEATADVASPVAEKVAVPPTPIVVPTYSALAIEAPPSVKIPPDTDDDDASPVAEKVAIPDTPRLELIVAAPVRLDVPPTFRFVPT